jgi:RNA polymerase sigma factor (sigma-70 family)
MRTVRSEDTGWPGDDLVTAAQNGDLDSIHTLAGASHPHVHRFARTVCLTEQDAEDATEEALITFYRKIGTLRASAALASWMFRIVRNECLRRIVLARRRRHEPIESMIDATRGASVEDEVLERLEAERVATAIAALPDDQRRVLILRDVYGHGGKPVADRLGLSMAAMKFTPPLRQNRVAHRTARSAPAIGPAGNRHPAAAPAAGITDPDRGRLRPERPGKPGATPTRP